MTAPNTSAWEPRNAHFYVEYDEKGWQLLVMITGRREDVSNRVFSVRIGDFNGTSWSILTALHRAFEALETHILSSPIGSFDILAVCKLGWETMPAEAFVRQLLTHVPDGGA